MANSLYEKLNNSFSHNQTRALANTVYPVYYGGSYINKNNKLVVYIAGPITKGTNELFQKLDPNEIIVEACDYSYQELHKVMDVIDEYKLNHSNGDPIADNFNIWCIRDSLNRVIVELEECNDARIREFKKNVVDAPSLIFKQSRGKVQLHSYLDAGQMMNSPQGSFSNGYRAQQYGVIWNNY